MARDRILAEIVRKGGGKLAWTYRSYVQVAADPARHQLTVDLRGQRVTAPDGRAYSFEIAASDREMLLEGLDAIALTMKRDDEIPGFQGRERLRRP